MHRAQQPVTSYDDELRGLVADMVATMHAADGVGLAACQIGVDLAVFVFDCPNESLERTVGVVCNPVLTLPEGLTGSWTRPRRAARRSPARSWSARDPTSPRSPGPGSPGSRSPSPVMACSDAASSTRPTTPWARSSETGSRPSSARSSRSSTTRPSRTTRLSGRSRALAPTPVRPHADPSLRPYRNAAKRS